MGKRKRKSIKRKIRKAQKEWAKAVVAIGKAEDFKKEANRVLDNLYDFENGDSILFKPTLAREVPVRVNREQTASYFIGGSICEDGKGFARTPWEEVTFEKEIHFEVLDSGDVMVMGRCIFRTCNARKRPHRRKAVADYTFGYRKGSMKIFLHHSSLKVTKKEQGKCKKTKDI